MGIQEVQSQSGASAYQKRKKAGRVEGFQESLLQNLKNRDQDKHSDTAVEPEAKQTVTGMQIGAKAKAEQAGMGRIGAAQGIRVNAAVAQKAMQAVEVRHMSYEDSDHVRIAVTEGYTLKGKRENGAEPRVYVEAKYEDGRVEAYQVEMARVSGQTGHVIEQFALETMKEGE